MTFKNIRHHNPCDSRTLFEIGVPFYKAADLPEDNKPRMQTIIIDGLTVIEESDAAAGTEYIQVHGEVDRLMVSNAMVMRGSGLQPAGHLLTMKEHSRLATLHLKDITTTGLESLVAGTERIGRIMHHNVTTDESLPSGDA